jgi:hypothetical protein
MSCVADIVHRFPSTLPVFIYNYTNMDSTEPHEEQLVQRAAPPTKVKGLAKRPPSRPVSQLLPSPVEKTPTSATSSHRTSPQAGSPASPLPSGNAAAAASTTAAATTASGPKMQPQQYDEARQRIFDDVQGNDESQQDVRGGKPSFSEKAVKADTRRILGDDEAEDYRRPAKQVRPKYPYPQQQQQVYPDHASGYGGNYGGDGQWYGGGAEGGPYNTQGYEPYPDSGYPQQQGHHHMYSQHHHHHHHQHQQYAHQHHDSHHQHHFVGGGSPDYYHGGGNGGGDPRYAQAYGGSGYPPAGPSDYDARGPPRDPYQRRGGGGHDGGQRYPAGQPQQHHQHHHHHHRSNSASPDGYGGPGPAYPHDVGARTGYYPEHNAPPPHRGGGGGMHPGGRPGGYDNRPAYYDGGAEYGNGGYEQLGYPQAQYRPRGGERRGGGGRGGGFRGRGGYGMRPDDNGSNPAMLSGTESSDPTSPTYGSSPPGPTAYHQPPERAPRGPQPHTGGAGAGQWAAPTGAMPVGEGAYPSGSRGVPHGGAGGIVPPFVAPPPGMPAFPMGMHPFFPLGPPPPDHVLFPNLRNQGAGSQGPQTGSGGHTTPQHGPMASAMQPPPPPPGSQPGANVLQGPRGNMPRKFPLQPDSLSLPPSLPGPSPNANANNYPPAPAQQPLPPSAFGGVGMLSVKIGFPGQLVPPPSMPASNSHMNLSRSGRDSKPASPLTTPPSMS